jgi:hypothetical protein
MERCPQSMEQPKGQAEQVTGVAALDEEVLRRANGRQVPLLLLVCLVPFAARAEPDAVSEPSPPNDAPALRRELAGHNFIPSKFSLDPFVSTYVSAETGFGYGTAPGHVYDIAGNPIGLADYEAGAFAQLLSFQYGFVDWWAVRASAKIIVYSGLNTSGAAGIGTNAVANAGLGTTLSFKVGDRLRLGGSLDVIFGPSVFFNIIQAVKDSIQNGEITSPVDNTSAFTFNPAFVGAWAIQKWVGFTFSAGYQHTSASSGTNSATANLIAVNGVFDFDLASLNWVPIGFLGGFETEFSVDSTKFRQFRYQFGVFYTGVKALNVGLEIVYQRAPVVGATDIFLSSVQALIVLQYNFN